MRSSIVMTISQALNKINFLREINILKSVAKIKKSKLSINKTALRIVLLKVIFIRYY